MRSADKIASLRIGTCSWKYPEWKGLVYTTDNPSAMLPEYAARFTTVEVDQWFWSIFEVRNPVLPREEDVVKYASAVPDDFRFSVKMQNSTRIICLRQL